VLKAERKLDDAKSASSTQVLTSGIEIGASVLGAMFGSGRRSAATAASRAARSARTVTRSSSSKESAQADLDQAKEELQRLQTDVNAALEEIKKSWHPEHAEIVEKPVAAKKADLKIERFVLTWVPV
jgi:multidrug resistance efflux pump